jgi:hypothetical protein
MAPLLVLPNEFLQVDEFSVNQIIKKVSTIIDTLAFSLPSKHNAGHLLPDKLPADLLHAPSSGGAAAALSCISRGPTTAPMPSSEVLQVL